MDKESIYDLQKIDCNCNDCAYMVRDIDRYKLSVIENERLQRSVFDGKVDRLKAKARHAKEKFYDLETWDAALTEAESMKFQFNKKSACINFGTCTKFDKPVSFIPTRCQVETQGCFLHRKDLV